MIRKSMRLFLIVLCAAISVSTYARKHTYPHVNIDTSVQTYTDIQKSGFLASIKYVVDNNLLISKLDENNLLTLPVGLPTSDGKVLIVVDSVRYTRQGTFVRAIASVILPGTTEPLVFAGSNIALSSLSLSASSLSRLTLISEHIISINDHIDLVLPADGHNYIEWDCQGFKDVNIKGNFVFDQEYIIPDSVADARSKNVTASLEINAKDIHNILASVNVSPFQIVGLDGFGFSVQNAVVDMSDIANPTGFSFPQAYQSEYQDNINLWRGFYLQKLKVRLPPQFKSATKNISIDATNMLIDDNGVSGIFGANNVLNDGIMDGWPFTVDRIEAVVIRNQLTGGGASGAVNIPFLGEDTLGYAARIYNDTGHTSYSFAVITRQDKKYGMPFGGTLTLNPGSSVEVSNSNNTFKAKAVLNGNMTVNQELLHIDSVRFQNLTLVTQAPYITAGYFSSVTSKSKLGSFPVQFDSLSLGINNGNVVLGVTAHVNFMGEDDKGFSGSAYIKALAKNTQEVIDAKQNITKTKWTFEGVVINDIAVSYSGAFSISGRLSIYHNDPTYGNGFRGALDLKLPAVGQIKAACYFGNKEQENYKYWNASLLIPTKIPIAGPLYINGIMGGLGYHMKRPTDFKPTFNNTDTALKSSGTAQMIQLDYVPDQTAGLNVMAGVSLVAASQRVFKGDAAFEITFRDGGGIKYVSFKGDAFFLQTAGDLQDVKGMATSLAGNTALDGQTLPTGKGAPLYATLNVLYDVDNSTFHANLSAYLNAYNIVYGSGPNKLLGEAVIHVSPSEWYIYAGRPSAPMGIELLHLFSANAYFMVGSKLEAFPPPPPEVAGLFDFNSNFMAMENQMATGGGFGVGARFNTSFGIDDWFYAYLKIGAGADMMLRDMTDVQCAGRNGPIGFDGWYASAQAYAYLDGRVGVFGIDILRLSAAFLMQAKLPNPSWFRAAVGVRYSILCGLVKGKFTVNVQFGDECKLVSNGNELGGIKLIGDVAPVNGSSTVDVFAAPQTAFNTAIGQEFTMMNISDQVNTYRVTLDEFKLYNGNAEIPGATVQWNRTNDVALLNYRDVLPGNSNLHINVKAHLEKKTGSGSWQQLQDAKGLASSESQTSAFTTGDVPTTISDNNVAYAYPVKQQFNFYKDEYGQGYIKLIKGTPSVFPDKDTSGRVWKYIARFVKADGTQLETPVMYDAGNAQVNFAMPQGLTNNTVYVMSYVKTLAEQQAADNNLQRNQVTTASGDNETTVTQNSLSGNVQNASELEIYNSAMRTSKYNTFSDKINAFTSKENLFDISQNYLALIALRNSTDEIFDMYELQGDNKNIQPMVYAEATTDNNWYSNFAYPLLYEKYPADNNITIQWRSTDTYGIAPLKAINTYNDIQKDLFILSEAEVGAGTTQPRSGKVVNSWLVSYFAAKDYQELKNKAAAKYLYQGFGNVPEAATRLLLNNMYEDIIPGDYGLKLKYRLPGINKVTTEKQLYINYR